MRCQRYGHTKTYCRRPYRYVKCGDEHKTDECTKQRDTPAKCALCDGAHPSSYKGCAVYQEILRQRNNTIQRPHWHRTNAHEQQTRTHMKTNTNNVRNNTSYAQITRMNTERQDNHLNIHANLTDILANSFAELKTILTQQTELMNSLMKLMTTFITNLSRK